MLIGTSDHTKVYLNGDVIYHTSSVRPFVEDQDIVTGITFKKGINTLIFKSAKDAPTEWKGSVRFTAKDGKPLAGIRLSLTP
jgi:hypothetical protein